MKYRGVIKIKNLIVKAINGDKEAFDELALSMKNYLYHEAKTKLYNSQDVEDAVQSTLYVAYKEIHTLRTPYGFKSWITTILYNQCYKICKDDIKHKKVIQKMSKYARVAEPEFDIDEFDNLIQGLSDKEKNIIELLCRKDLTYKQVAKKLNMNESTVKYYAKTRFSMLKELLDKRTVIIFILCFFIVGVVSAITLISYLKRAVSTEDVGVNNDGVLMAIENLDWYQQVDMDYKDLGDGYRIKMEHLSMDEMCLYMIFDLESDKDISNLTDVSLSDLKIINENSDVICDKNNMNIEQYARVFGSRLIENNTHHAKFLIYMYTDFFPASQTLYLDFSTILLTEKTIFSTLEQRLNVSVDFEINLIKKFVDRNYITYNSADSLLKKAIISETGFYAIFDLQDFTNSVNYLLDENNTLYNCYVYTFTNFDKLSCIVVSEFNDINNKKLKLSIFNKNFELINQD